MDIKQDIENLVQIYGPDKVKAAARQLLEAAYKPIPAEHLSVLSPLQQEYVLKQLDDASLDVDRAISHRAAVGDGKGELIKEKTQLETAIKLSEAEAFMNTFGEGKEQYGMIEDKKIMLNNDTNRDAYRRQYSAADRRTLAEVCGDLNAIDVDIAQANDMLQAALEKAHIARSKAGLQAALLNYLAGRA